MNYRRFGNTGLQVSEVGFGSWAIGGDAMVGSTPIGWGPADDAVSKQAIHAALDAGINFFDTADIYGLGHSEQLLGETLKGRDVVIATKAGNVARNNAFGFDYSKAHILHACEASLKRLRREQIDFYQLHTARLHHLQNEECVEAMQLLLQQGKIRYWGISLNTFAPDPEAAYFLRQEIGQGFQLVLNIINQRALAVMKKAAARGYGIIARMPLQFGLLTGKFSQETKFETTDHRHNRLTKEVIGKSLETLEPVWSLCNKYNCTKTQLAMSFVLSYPEVSTVIPGIRTAQHVADNTTGLVRLQPEDIQYLETLGSTAMFPLMELIEKHG